MDFLQSRRNMVDGQLLPNHVHDLRIIAAMTELPREAFVPAANRGIAYLDEALPLGGGRFLMEPMLLARLVESLALRDEDAVLDVGCGTGYGTALLARLADTVVGLECDEGLAAQAGEILDSHEVSNAVVVPGSLVEGYAKQAPYDAILLSGAVAEIPPQLIAQLSGEGGRLAAVVQRQNGLTGQAVLLTKTGESASFSPLFDAGTPLLPGCEHKSEFVF